MWSKKHVCQYLATPSTVDDETSEKELETCYESSDSLEEPELNMTGLVAVPGPSCWDKKMWTRKKLNTHG